MESSKNAINYWIFVYFNPSFLIYYTISHIKVHVRGREDCVQPSGQNRYAYHDAGKNEYFVKWVGYDSSQNTWEPEKNLTTVKDLIQKYNANLNKNTDLRGPSSLRKKSSASDGNSDE